MTDRRDTNSKRHPADAATSRPDGGSTSVIVALLLPALVVVAAIAIDLAYFYDRASRLQSAADAAALAGVIEVSTGADPTAEVSAVLRANGFEPGSLTVSNTPGVQTLETTVTESDVQLFFSSLFFGNYDLTRSATAEYNNCGAICETTLTFPQPLEEITVTGTGDPFVPVLVGDKMYALIHHAHPTNRNLRCVDRTTNDICYAGTLQSFPRFMNDTAGIAGISGAGSFYTNTTPELTVVGTRIYFVGQRQTDVGAGCWDTVTDTSCGYLQLATYPNGDSWNYSVRMGGPDLVNGDLYFEADDHKVYCVTPGITMSVCAGSWPVDSGLIAAGAPTFEFQEGANRASPVQDSEVIGDKIFATFPFHMSGPTIDHTNDGGWIHCFDTSIPAPCTNWPSGGAVKVVPQVAAAADPRARIYTRFASDLSPNGVCYHDVHHDACLDLNGHAVSTPSIPIVGKRAEGELYFDGRTYFPDRHASRTYCWDWATGASCTGVNTDTWIAQGAGTTQDYGYVTDGKCIYGLGHSSIFWSFDSALNSPCSASIAEATVTPCTCVDGTVHWGRVTITNVNLARDVEFTQFQIQITDPAGNVLDTRDMLDTDGDIDLGGIDTTIGDITITAEIEAVAGHDPWAIGTPPLVTIRFTDIPRLTN